MAKLGSYHGGHHHVLVCLGLLPAQLLLGIAQLIHQAVDFVVQFVGILQGLLGILLGLGRALASGGMRTSVRLTATVRVRIIGLDRTGKVVTPCYLVVDGGDYTGVASSF